jgi:flavin-dependent thymidylate synthase
MIIKLAAFNIDIDLINQIENKNLATPETISAAYARISRSQKNVTELRSEALHEVDKARSSNENIIYEMGHSSIAEHAVFNFDLIGISRIMSEYIQKTRLASFTEKSQRYVTLKGDFVIPEEIESHPELKDKYLKLINDQNCLYNNLFEKAKELLNPEEFSSKRDLEGKAKEDARYVLSLATQTQMGITINGRSLERLLRRLDACPLLEAKKLKTELENQVRPIAPSLIKYTKADKYGEMACHIEKSFEASNISAHLIEYDDNSETKILTAYLMDEQGVSYKQASAYVSKMTEDEVENCFDHLFKGLKSYHNMPRAFEMADVTLEMSMSSSCFGQLKRHRMASIFRSSYHPDLSFIIPPLIQKTGMNEAIQSIMQSSETLYNEFEKLKPGLGIYCLTNAHVINVLMKCNLRELYHFVRLRSDSHAQWEIKEISDQVVPLIKNKFPNAAKYLCGKHDFSSID